LQPLTSVWDRLDQFFEPEEARRKREKLCKYKVSASDGLVVPDSEAAGIRYSEGSMPLWEKDMETITAGTTNLRDLVYILNDAPYLELSEKGQELHLLSKEINRLQLALRLHLRLRHIPRKPKLAYE